MTTKPLKKGATYDDLRDVPDHYVAEMFDGELYASPRPAIPHAHAASVLGGKLNSAFHRLGPGGWVILSSRSSTSATTCSCRISRAGGASDCRGCRRTRT